MDYEYDARSEPAEWRERELMMRLLQLADNHIMEYQCGGVLAIVHSAVSGLADDLLRAAR